MAFRQLILCCIFATALTYAMYIDELPEGVQRDKRDATEDALSKMKDAFEGFKESFGSLAGNISQSEIYKQFEKIGADLNDKGKELGAKIEETLSNLKKNAGGS